MRQLGDPLSCGLITLGNEIQLALLSSTSSSSCGLITLGNEIQPSGAKSLRCSVVD